MKPVARLLRAGARDMLQSGALADPLPTTSTANAHAASPGPDAASEAPPRADMVFVLSAPLAMLAPDKLALTGVSSSAQFVTDEKKSGAVGMDAFANSSAGALFVLPSGEWLGKPVGVLHAAAGGNATSALLQLSAPHYMPATRTLTFQSRILTLDISRALQLRAGAAARLAEDAGAGVEAANALAGPSEGGAPMTDAALFIDQSTQALSSTAQVRWLWSWPCWWSPGYYEYHGGWGWWG
ncbi:hypothetical protein WJX81_006985 [Elliptochloris bilobata]|uniref:Uncharacterized protein n=1 Tax=Elliptochloris bilobata TaxID=381761 RepID=A0AAW1QL41_9CHLO